MHLEANGEAKQMLSMEQMHQEPYFLSRDDIFRLVGLIN